MPDPRLPMVLILVICGLVVIHLFAVLASHLVR